MDKYWHTQLDEKYLVNAENIVYTNVDTDADEWKYTVIISNNLEDHD